MKKWNTSEAMAPIFEKIEMLTKLQRILICCAGFLLLIGSFVYFSYMPKIEEVQKLEKQRSRLESQLATARKKARQLAEYREKKKKAEANFLVAKKVLPEKKEIPSLLTSVSRAGQDAGLEFLKFKPQGENRKSFYAEIPVAIQLSGPYHSVAVFFDNVSRLYRIVNIRDIKMDAEKNGKSLKTSCTAVTYRFVEPEKQKDSGKKKKRRRRRR